MQDLLGARHGSSFVKENETREKKRAQGEIPDSVARARSLLPEALSKQVSLHLESQANKKGSVEQCHSFVFVCSTESVPQLTSSKHDIGKHSRRPTTNQEPASESKQHAISITL